MINIKKLSFLMLVTLLCSITLFSCTTKPKTLDSSNNNVEDNVSRNIPSVGDIVDDAEIISSNSHIKGDSMTAITIQIKDKIFMANLLNNDATKKLISQMPFTLNMSDLNKNEKFYRFTNSFPTNTERIGLIHTGDLMLYGSDYLVLFYEDFQPSYSYTRLGNIEDALGLKDALGTGNIEITFTVVD